MIVLLYCLCIALSIVLLKQYMFTFVKWCNLTHKQIYGLFLISLVMCVPIIVVYCVAKGMRYMCNPR